MVMKNKRTRRSVCFAALAVMAGGVSSLLCAAAPPALAQGNNSETARNIRAGKRPRLVVVVSIDQFRADYLRRFADLFLPADAGKGKVGGFRHLMINGSDFLDARFEHFPLYTGPGHAVILSGSHPYQNGIVSNDWWSREEKKRVYCVDDSRYQVVGALPTSKATPMGPLNMRTSTVGDELKLATAGRAKVITLSLKDRAAILLGGHAQDTSIWFDTEGGRWISSTAFCRNGRLPDWVDSLNREAIPDRSLGKAWTSSQSLETLSARTFAPHSASGASSSPNLAFSHALGAEKTAANYAAFTVTPDANAYVLETAKRAVTAEKLGQRDGVSDLLAINLATNDYVGHAYGPYSPEALDTTIQSDRQLSDFLNFLNGTVPGGLKNIVVVLTADHGVAPVPEDTAYFNIVPKPSARFDTKIIPQTIQAALSARFGNDTWIDQSADGKATAGFVENFVYLHDKAIARALASGKAQSRAQIETAAADAVNAKNIKGIYTVYTRSQVITGALPNTSLSDHLEKGIHPAISGDLVVINEAMYLGGGGSSGTSHGTAYAYDTHVPIVLSGFGIAPGVWAERVSPADIAPTLCTLLGIEYPSGCDGTILKPALR